MKVTLSFCGGAGSVTGANFLLEGAQTKLLVDCGLVQGERFAAAANREPFPFDPASVHFLCVTHAHIDHIGRIPQLVRAGFKGRIMSTQETRELAALMFPDALTVMRAENKDDLLYDEQDIAAALALWETVAYHEKKSVGEFEILLRDAGHILGSAMIEMRRGGAARSIVFTGDLGNSPSPLLPNTEAITDAHYIVMESVYGDRNHEEQSERRERLAQAVRENAARGGVFLIPCFSIEKTQVILSELDDLLDEQKIPATPVYLDSPLAIKITEVYKKYLPDFKKDLFSFQKLDITLSREESQTIFHRPSPKIIIAGSGMSEGGRIVEHEKHFLSDPKNTILFVGYQAVGSLGRRIQEGIKKVKIGHEEMKIRARVSIISGYSSHKDGAHLLEFVEQAAEKKTLEKVFVTMGEPRASLFLAQRIRDYTGTEAVVPPKGERVELSL